MKAIKKRDFTVAEHKLLGACLVAVKVAGRVFYNNSVDYYGKTAKVSKRLSTVLFAVENLRAVLDDRAEYYYSPHQVLWNEETERSVPPETYLLRVFAGVLTKVEDFLQNREYDGLAKFLNQDQNNLTHLGSGKELLKKLNEHADEQFPRNRSIRVVPSKTAKYDRLFNTGRSD
ncbi:hypothetical protein KAI46_14560 [bacterium]|nr:hypothetical protein [bacterium]